MWTILKLDQKKINLLKDDLLKNLGSDFLKYITQKFQFRNIEIINY